MYYMYMYEHMLNGRTKTNFITDTTKGEYRHSTLSKLFTLTWIKNIAYS